MDASPGFYGKFPELGDFVNRRLPKEFLDSWDDWLQGSVSTSLDQLGEDWLNLYLSSPVWKFALSRGLCGEYPWYGVVMPSVDRVGRYFPLTVACRLPLDANIVQIAMYGSSWFDKAEEVVISVLDQHGFNMEGFDSQVVGLGTLNRLTDNTTSRTDIGYGTAWQIPTSEGSPNLAIPSLTHQLIQQRLGDYSLWWGSGSDSVTPSMLLCSGMPQSNDYAAMLSGEWSTGSWEQWPAAEAYSESERPQG